MSQESRSPALRLCGTDTCAQVVCRLRIHNAFNDVDLGMKLEQLGLRHVSLGHVAMVHLETATRAPGVQGFEAAVLEQRWASSMATEHLHFTDQLHSAVRT